MGTEKVVQLLQDIVANYVHVTATEFHGVPEQQEQTIRARYANAERILGELPLAHGEVIKLRYGFKGAIYYYYEIGKACMITAERAKRIEAEALEMLADPEMFKKLKT